MICNCIVCLAIVAAVGWLVASPTARLRLAANTVFALARLAELIETAAKRPPKAAILAALALALSGCAELEPQPRIRRLPAPPPEQPAANLPAALHIRNWRGPKGEGSCVHASLKNLAAWDNDWEFVNKWPHGDGEWDTQVRQRLDAFGRDYAFTRKADPRFLDWASGERRGAIIWWKPSHCCAFMGWVQRDGIEYAAILDNNYPGRFELVEREKFVRLWLGFGGFALSFIHPPATNMPYKSYEAY